MKLSALVAVIVLALAAQAQADTLGQKLKRGNANLFLSGLEVPRTIKQVNRDHGALAAATWGPLKGIGLGLRRKLVGAHEIVTGPIPWPKNYAPIIQPEYPWSTEKK